MERYRGHFLEEAFTAYYSTHGFFKLSGEELAGWTAKNFEFFKDVREEDFTRSSSSCGRWFREMNAVKDIQVAMMNGTCLKTDGKAESATDRAELPRRILVLQKVMREERDIASEKLQFKDDFLRRARKEADSKRIAKENRHELKRQIDEERNRQTDYEHLQELTGSSPARPSWKNRVFDINLAILEDQRQAEDGYIGRIPAEELSKLAGYKKQETRYADLIAASFSGMRLKLSAHEACTEERVRHTAERAAEEYEQKTDAAPDCEKELLNLISVKRDMEQSFHLLAKADSEIRYIQNTCCPKE